MSQAENIKTYSYRPAWYFYFFTIFIGINPILIQSSGKIGEENGYNIFSIMFEKSPKAGWVFLAVFIAFTLYALVVFYFSLKPNRTVIITDDSITAPKSLVSEQIYTIKIVDIDGIKSPTWLNNNLVIHHRKGNLNLPRAGFGSKMVHDNVYFSITSSLRARKNAA